MGVEAMAATGAMEAATVSMDLVSTGMDSTGATDFTGTTDSTATFMGTASS